MTDPEVPTGHVARWYVLYVKPRSEKKVMEWLAFYGAFRHLPTYVKVRKVQRRKVRTVMPLFPGYVFSRMTPHQRLSMLETNRIFRTIEVANPRPMIHQLRQIAHAARNAPMPGLISPQATVFKAGDRVRVVSGPFYGLVGYIEKATSRLFLNIDILGRSVAIQISPADVEKADGKG